MYTLRTQFMALHFHYLLPLLRCPRHRPHFLDGTAHIDYVEYLTRSFLHHTITANTQLITITMSLLQIPQALRLSYTCLLIHPITQHLRSQLILYAYALTDSISKHRDWFIKDIDGVSHFRPPQPSFPIPSHPPLLLPQKPPPSPSPRTPQTGARRTTHLSPDNLPGDHQIPKSTTHPTLYSPCSQPST